MSDTKIEWADVTWNPVTGCEKVSQGCRNCYAERVFDRMAKNPKTPVYHGRKFTDVQVHPERLGDPLRWKKPRRVFVNSMSDLFHEDVPDEFILRVVNIMRECSQHTFIVLTKRPERMRDFTRRCRWWPDEGRMWLSENPDVRDGFRPFGGAGCTPWPNIWLGVSVEDQATADERIPILVETPAAIKCVSYEPAIGPVDFRKVPGFNRVGQDLSNWWVIAGGESGPNARPSHPDWFRLVRDQCKAAGVPYFFKQWGEWGYACKYYEEGAEGEDLIYEYLDYDHHLWDGSHEWCTELEGQPPLNTVLMARVGKKAAGRLLDGVEHNEFPAAAR